MTSSEKNFLLINAFVGLCYKIVGWDKSLYELGYQVAAIEYPFKNAKGNEVKPEIIASSLKQNHSLLMESKSGGIDTTQIVHYSNIQVGDLVQRANILINNPSTHQFDVFILCNDFNKKTAIVGVSKTGINFPVVCLSNNAGSSYFKKDYGNFKNTVINNLFTNGINLPAKYAPRNLIPFMSDKDFPDYIIAKFLLVAVVSFMSKNAGRIFEIPTLLSQAIPYNLFDCYHTEERKRIINKATVMLTNLAKDSVFEQFFKRIDPSKNPAKFQIIKCPGDEIPTEKTRLYQRLQERTHEVVLNKKAAGLSSYQIAIDDIMGNEED